MVSKYKLQTDSIEEEKGEEEEPDHDYLDRLDKKNHYIMQFRDSKVLT